MKGEIPGHSMSQGTLQVDAATLEITARQMSPTQTRSQDHDQMERFAIPTVVEIGIA